MKAVRFSLPKPSAILCMIGLVLVLEFPSPCHQTQPPQGQKAEHGVEVPKPKSVTKRYSLVVIVLTDSRPIRSPVKRAEVTLFAGEYKETSSTNGEGKVSFNFRTDAKTATVRIRADHYKTDQHQVSLSTVGNEYKVLLERGDDKTN